MFSVYKLNLRISRGGLVSKGWVPGFSLQYPEYFLKRLEFQLIFQVVKSIRFEKSGISEITC